MRHCRRRGATPLDFAGPRGARTPMNSTAPADSPPSIAWPDAARHALFDAWFAGIAARHGLRASTLCPASSDASFRRYLRVQGDQRSFIVMDAPPAHEDVRPFVHVAEMMLGAGL